MFERAKDEFGADNLRWDRYPGKGGAPNFPVQTRDGRIVSSLAISETLRQLPTLSIDYVFADREIAKDVDRWLEANRSDVIQPPEGDAHE